MFKNVILILCLVFVTACKLKQNSHLQDLNFVYRSILENHPGVYNEKDPNFLMNLENAYITAKITIKESKTSSNSKRAINDFAKSFNDIHLWIHWLDNVPRKQNHIIAKFSISKLCNANWITIPTFNLAAEQEKVFKEILKPISELEVNKYIIFDLRGNQGGNSDYGSQIIDALFGKEYANQKRCLHNKNVYVDWRASKGNLTHILSLLTRYPKNHWLQTIENGLQKSLQQEKKLYREYYSEYCDPKKTLVLKPRLAIKIIVITESANVSAALDFIDELKIMTQNVTLIGQKTKADRLYMEVRSINLPSNRGQLFFPIKVYRNRMRADNEIYTPNIAFADILNTASLQSFILEKIGCKEL